MNDFIRTIILGIVEGLTEFLPVSSTAHLRLVEPFMGISLEDPYWKMYSIVIQLGAILAVVLYFRQRLTRFIRTYPTGATGQKNWLTHPLALVALAFLVTAGPGFLIDHFTKTISAHLSMLNYMAYALIAGGIAMIVVDLLCTRPDAKRVEDMGPLDAIWIGAWQIASAVFPGTSRSMITIASGQVFGLSRAAALEFSFLLSIPTMIVACGYELAKTLLGGSKDAAAMVPSYMTPTRWGVLAIGFIISFFVAWAVIAWFMHWVQKHGFVSFGIYRIILGVVVLIGLAAGWWPAG